MYPPTAIMTGMLRAAINDPALLQSERARQIMGPLVSIKCQHGNVSTAIAVELRAALLRGHKVEADRCG